MRSGCRAGIETYGMRLGWRLLFLELFLAFQLAELASCMSNAQINALR